MPLPAVLTYNELNGEEVKHVLKNRFEQVLEAVPYFQRHMTLPRVRMTMQVTLEVYADQPTPDIIPLSDRLQVIVESEPKPTETFTAETLDSTAPGSGDPPDQLREMHGLPIMQPARGPQNIGAQIATSDFESLEGREVQGLPGLKISRTGSGMIDGMPTSANATVAKIDQGPAGLRSGQMHRDAWRFGGGKNE